MAVFYIAALAPTIEARQNERAQANALFIIRGRITCIEESGRRSDALVSCDGPASRYGIVNKDAKLFKFDNTDPSTKVFTDARVRARDLQITARLNAREQLELIKLQSVREGKLYDIYYFCEVCNIRAYSPGPCPCCRNELEFRETPQ
jgi:hypothetical protein